MKNHSDVLQSLSISEENYGTFAGDWVHSREGDVISSQSPIDGELIGNVYSTPSAQFEKVIKHSIKAYEEWSDIPAPKRGSIIQDLGMRLKAKKKELGSLVTIEAGKTVSEGNGEIQEMIDIADLCVGLSRQLHGLVIASERPSHRMLEQYLPLGPIAVITSFNFPSSVWSWNSFIAATCGNSVIWKPSSKTPLIAVAITKLIGEALEENGAPQIFSLVTGSGEKVGNLLSEDRRIKLVSFTGSVRSGRHVSETVSRRLGKTILELGGNNAAIVTGRSEMSLALKGVAFGALATAGQRCTSTRRCIIHESIYDAFVAKLISIYNSVKVGDPRQNGTLVGPLIDDAAVRSFENAISVAKKEGAKLLAGGERVSGRDKKGFYVRPALIEAAADLQIAKEETFAPILYLFKYRKLEDAVRIHNSVPQGLSSSIFTEDLRESEYFLSHRGSDCGIVNVNTGTAGAEIGGAFGGEKDTGGGRESGSDAWKNYMRRETVTINYGDDVPLAQGVEFKV